MSRVPEIYAEWISLLDDFAAGINDKETIPAMQQGRVYWCDTTGQRLSRRIYQAFDHRIKLAGDRFSKAQDDGMPIERALDLLKNEWNLIFAAADISCLPQKGRETLAQYLQRAAAGVQQSLESSAQGDRNGELSLILQRRKTSRK